MKASLDQATRCVCACFFFFFPGKFGEAWPFTARAKSTELQQFKQHLE